MIFTTPTSDNESNKRKKIELYPHTIKKHKSYKKSMLRHRTLDNCFTYFHNFFTAFFSIFIVSMKKNGKACETNT